MKIFNMIKSEKNTINEKIQTVNRLLEHYSTDEIEIIFYKIFEKNKELNLFKYRFNQTNHFEHRQLNLKLVNFFRKFDMFEIESFRLFKDIVKEFIWDEELTPKEELFTNYKHTYVKIGFYDEGDLCVREKGLNFYEENIIGVDDEDEESVNVLEDDNIFLNLVFEILYCKYEKLSPKEMNTAIQKELN